MCDLTDIFHYGLSAALHCYFVIDNTYNMYSSCNFRPTSSREFKSSGFSTVEFQKVCYNF